MIKTKKITIPTTKLPPITNWPKALMMPISSPLPKRIILVVETFKDKRKIVRTRSREGKEENSMALTVYIIISRVRMPNIRLAERNMSSKKGGRGTIIIMTMLKTPIATKISVFFIHFGWAKTALFAGIISPY